MNGSRACMRVCLCVLTLSEMHLQVTQLQQLRPNESMNGKTVLKDKAD